MAPITTKGHEDAWGLSRPWPGAMVVPKGHTASRAMVTSRPELLPRAMPVSMVLLQLRSVLRSVACITTRVHMNHVCWNPKAMLSCPPFTGPGRPGPVPHWPPQRVSCPKPHGRAGPALYPHGRAGSSPHHTGGSADPHGLNTGQLIPMVWAQESWLRPWEGRS